MTISFPVSLPTTLSPAAITITARSAVGQSISPFSMTQQVFEHQGEVWAAQIEMPPMVRADAENWIAFLLSLRGVAGTFYMGDPSAKTPRGTWAGSPLVVGAHAARVRSVAVDGFTVGATGKAGDWIQFGSTTTSRLHKVLQDFTANGSGQATIEIWPALRDALSDNAAFVTTEPKGIWRLGSNERTWDVGRALIYGLRFACVEAL